MAYQGIKSLTLPQQLASLRAAWPEGTASLDRNGLRWIGAVSPTPLSRQYMLQLTYQSPFHSPRVHVLKPSLKALAPSRIIPHLYCQRTERLCLYKPNLREWQPHLRLSHTMLPWATLWLLYFEDWVATDEWQGGGTHPTSSTPTTFTDALLIRLYNPNDGHHR